ncbi:PH domain-containing protein [Chryseobacterium aureum]|uniref:PH domain-containing protein n=1 Tax=Chryseobacterium aureum TaxID=2497456 RepID=UPI000F88620F|nr:PH domain-containing protein [Chryseobacterium aureum]
MKNLLATSEAYNSHIYYTAKIHWISYVIPFFLIAIGSLGVISFLLVGYKYMISFIGLFSLFLIYIFIRGLILLLRNRSTKIFITDSHLTLSQGILSKTSFDLSLQKLEGMTLHQNFLGKFLDFGTLIVSTGSLKHTYNIKHPQELRDAILMLKNNLDK